MADQAGAKFSCIQKKISMHWADEFKVRSRFVKNYVSNAMSSCQRGYGDRGKNGSKKDGKRGYPYLIPELRYQKQILHISGINSIKSIKHIHANMAAMESVFLL